MYKGDRPVFKEEGLREKEKLLTPQLVIGHLKTIRLKKKSGLPCHFSLTKRYMADDSKNIYKWLKDNYFQQQARFIRTERPMTKTLKEKPWKTGGKKEEEIAIGSSPFQL